MSRVIVAVYKLPECASCEIDDLRLHHEDLPRMTGDELWSEAERVRWSLAQTRAEKREGRRRPPVWVSLGAPLPAIAWLRERLTAVKAERERRGGGRSAT